MEMSIVMSERRFWSIVRAALLAIVKAIEVRYLSDEAPDPDTG
jgi:hypothetical protein